MNKLILYILLNIIFFILPVKADEPTGKYLYSAAFQYITESNYRLSNYARGHGYKIIIDNLESSKFIFGGEAGLSYRYKVTEKIGYFQSLLFRIYYKFNDLFYFGIKSGMNA